MLSALVKKYSGEVEFNTKNTDFIINDETGTEKEVEFHGNRIKMEANVENFALSAKTVTLLGREVLINASTGMEMDNDNVTDPIIFQAPVDGLRDPSFTLLGVTVITSGATDFKYFNSLSQLKRRDLVKEEGTLSSGRIIATEVELED